MSIELPDWLRGVVLLGRTDGGEIVPVLIDDAGQINILIRGDDGAGTVRTVKVDELGQLYAVLRGAGNVDVAVDASGYLSAILKGQKPDTSLATVALDASGRIVMVPYGTTTVAGTATVTQAEKDREIQGADGATLRTIAVDASGQMIMVPRGSSGYYLAVDANGYMAAVLKGIFAGELHTISVDADGRIEAFALDAEDQWGQVLKTGNSELAARLGSPVTWDWRGNVLYSCDFSKGFGMMERVSVGTGAGVALGPDYGDLGGYAVKLTAGSSAGGYAHLNLYIGSNPATRIGLAARFAIDTNTAYVRAFVEHYIGANSPYGYVRLDVANDKLQLYSQAGEWMDVASIAVNKYVGNYCWLKLVIDQTAKYYERALYNETEVDLSAYPCPTTTSGWSGSILAQFGHTGREGYNDVVYVDELVLTVNEPENA